MTVSQIKKKNRKTLITLFPKAAQVCDNRWVETLKQAKSSISRLKTCWLCLRLRGPPRTPDGLMIPSRLRAPERLTIAQMTHRG